MSELIVTSSPHLRDKSSTRNIMLDVIIALVPAGIAGIIMFGFYTALLIAVTVLSAVLGEFLFNKVVKKPNSIGDLSAVVTGLLLAYNLYYDNWELAERSLLDMALLQKKYPLDRELLSKLNHDFALELDLGLPYAVFPEFFGDAPPLFGTQVPAAARSAIRLLAALSFARQVSGFLADDTHAPKPTAAARGRAIGRWWRNLPGYLHKTPAKRDRDRWRLCRILNRELPRYQALHQAARQSHGRF